MWYQQNSGAVLPPSVMVLFSSQHTSVLSSSLVETLNLMYSFRILGSCHLSKWPSFLCNNCCLFHLCTFGHHPVLWHNARLQIKKYDQFLHDDGTLVLQCNINCKPVETPCKTKKYLAPMTHWQWVTFLCELCQSLEDSVQQTFSVHICSGIQFQHTWLFKLQSGIFCAGNMKSRNGKNSMSHYTFWNPLLTNSKLNNILLFTGWQVYKYPNSYIWRAELWYFAPQKDVFSDRKVSTALSGIQEADRHAESALWMIFLSPLDTQLQCQHLRHRCHRGNQNILQFSSSCSSLSLVNGGSLRPKGQSSSSLAPDTLMMAARLSTPKSTSSNPI